jgi:hypothetical protein
LNTWARGSISPFLKLELLRIKSFSLAVQIFARNKESKKMEMNNLFGKF